MSTPLLRFLGMYVLSKGIFNCVGKLYILKRALSVSPTGRATSPKGRGLKFLSTLGGAFPKGEATLSPATRERLAAARARLGSDMPPAYHSLPLRRFATQRESLGV